MNVNELTLNEINDSYKHKLKVWLATLGVALFSGLVAVGVFATQSYKKSNAVSYDDYNQQITISGNELNYSYDNFYTFLSQHTDDLSFLYLNKGFSYLSDTSTAFSYSYNDDLLYFVYDYEGFHLDYEISIPNSNNKFVYYDSNSSTTTLLSDSLIISCDDDSIYSSLKTAIEQDIYDNTPLVLSAYDLNNKTYGYLANYLNTNAESTDFEGTYFVYDGVRYLYSSFGANAYIDFKDDNTGYYIELDLYSLYDFKLYDNDDAVYPFTHDLYIYSNYIKENIYAPMDTNGFISILDTIVSILTGGIVGVSTGVGAGVSTLVSDIFISNNALSVMGAMIVIFAGISLALGLSRWIMNFLISLGAKK